MSGREGWSRLLAGLAILLLGAGLESAGAATGAPMDVAKNWRIAVRSEERKEDVKLFGGEAYGDSNGIWHVTRLKLEVYVAQTNGGTLTNLVIEAPTSIWDIKEKTAQSDGEIRAWTPDGKFMTRGRGFRWSLDTGMLVITNGVRSSMVPPESAGKTNEGAKKEELEPINIRSIELHLSLSGKERFATYRRVVDVVDPSGVNMKAFELRVRLESNADGQNEVSEVVADGNVYLGGEFEGKDFEATGETAIYQVSPPMITMPDSPVIRSGGNLLRGRAASIDLADPENMILHVDGDMRMETVAEPNKDGKGKPIDQKEEGPTVILADSLRFEQKAGKAVFDRRVRVETPKGARLMADRVEAEVDAETGEIGAIEAAGNLRVEMDSEQGAVTATGDSATIDEENGLIVLRRGKGEQPTILQGPNVLKGDLVEMNAANAEDIRVKATGNTLIKAVDFGDKLESPVELKADRFSYGGKILLAEGGAELALVVPESDRAKAKPMRAFAESVIVDQKLGSLTLDKNVRLLDDAGMEATCDHLVADLPKADGEDAGRLSDMTAIGNVIIAVKHNDTLYKARGDRAVYSAERDEMIVTGHGRIETGANRVFGDRILASIAVPGETRMRAVGNARLEGEAETKDGLRKYRATADEMEIDEKAGKARLRRSVHIADNTGLDIRCEKLDADLPESDSKVVVAEDRSSVSGIPDFVAEEKVVARLNHEKGTFDLHCDKVIYVAETNTLELKGNITGKAPEGVVLSDNMKYSLKSRRSEGTFDHIVIDVKKARERRNARQQKK